MPAEFRDILSQTDTREATSNAATQRHGGAAFGLCLTHIDPDAGQPDEALRSESEDEDSKTDDQE